MQKMIKNNIIIEVNEEYIVKAESLGFTRYNGIKVANAEVNFDEWVFKQGFIKWDRRENS